MTVRTAPAAATPDAEARILALNNAHASEPSWLDPVRLAALIGQSFYAPRIDDAEAFLIAFDERAHHESLKSPWSRDRCWNCVHADRLAVASAARGRCHARRPHADLIGRTAVPGHRTVACEANRELADPASNASHAAPGFSEVGQAVIHGGGETVRHLMRPVR